MQVRINKQGGRFKKIWSDIMTITYKIGKGKGDQYFMGIGSQELQLRDEYKTMTLNKISKIIRDYFEIKDGEIELTSINFSFIQKEEKD